MACFHSSNYNNKSKGNEQFVQVSYEQAMPDEYCDLWLRAHAETRPQQKDQLFGESYLIYQMWFRQSEKKQIGLTKQEADANIEYEADEQKFDSYIRVLEEAQLRQSQEDAAESQRLWQEVQVLWQEEQQQLWRNDQEIQLAELGREVDEEILTRWREEQKEIEDLIDYNLGFIAPPPYIQILQNELWNSFALEQAAERQAELNFIMAKRQGDFINDFKEWEQQEEISEKEAKMKLMKYNEGLKDNGEKQIPMKPIYIFTNCQQWSCFQTPSYGVFKSQCRELKIIPISSQFDLSKEGFSYFDVQPIAVKNDRFLVGIIQAWASSLQLTDRQANYCICYESKSKQNVRSSLQGVHVLAGERVRDGETIRVLVNAEEVRFKVGGCCVCSSAIPESFVKRGIVPFVALFEEEDTVEILGELELY